MSGASSTDWVGDLGVARALTWRYVIALFLVASLSTAAWLSLHLVIAEQKSTAAVVNVSGRQRMLSQRTALFANLLVQAPRNERAPLRARLKESIELMERSHHGLIHGDQALGLPETMSRAVHSMYFDQPNGLDDQVETYVRTVDALLQLDDDSLQQNNPLLQYITLTAPSALVAGLDRMVRQYQVEGEAAVSRLQQAETIFWGVTLLLLVLEAGLIFHPFASHVKVIIGKLRQVTEKLRLHQEQLEDEVRQRTIALEGRSNALAESEEKFRLISTAAKDGIVIIGLEERVIYWNPAAEKIFGYTANEVIGKNMHSLITPARFRDAAHGGFERFRQYGVGNLIGKTFEIAALHKSGREFPIELSISAVRMQNNWHALGIIRDITERRQMEEQVRQLAFYDVLTSLPNRRLFHDRLNQAMVALKRSGRFGALMFLDLDNFKPLNDAYGHGVGDLLLIEAANRLKTCVREMDSVARFGGDEFVVMLGELCATEAESAEQAANVAEKIRRALSEPYLLSVRNDASEGDTIEHHCTVSIGIALFNQQQENPDEIMKWADMAMYQAKEAGRNLIRFREPG